MRSNFAGVAVVVALLALATVALGQPRTPREALEEDHPGVRFRDVGGRTRTVYGVPMTAGQTPEAAADAWLVLYGEIFIDGREAGGPDLRLFSDVRTLDGKAILGYAQWVDGVPVEASSARIMAVPEGGQWRVAYAASRTALRPLGGLPEPQVLSHEGLRAAQLHEAGVGLARWSAPELVAIYEDTPVGTGDATPTWKCIGASDNESRVFYVDAIAGTVIAHFSNASHVCETDISGTITGKKSPGTKPDRSDSGCENLPATEPMPLIKVEARDGTTLVASDFTDEDGDYVLDYDGPAQVTVKASLEWVGEAWTIIDRNNITFSCTLPTVNPVNASTVATSPSTGVNLLLNNSPTEYATAQLNTAHALWKTRDFIKSRIDPGTYPGLDEVIEVLVNVNVTGCNGRYAATCFGCNNSMPCLILEAASTECTNSGYATIVAHEYCHYVHEKTLGMTINDAGRALREGMCDALGLLVYDTDKIGEWNDLEDCDDDNYWRLPEADDPQYPWQCDATGPNAPYERSTLLSALWRDMRNSSMELATTSQLFVDWMFLAQIPTITACPVTSRMQAADPDTLVEVLTADDDDANLGTCSTNQELICQIFGARGIELADCDCAESVSTCFADCDRSTGMGVLDIFDFLCFQQRFSESDRRACDCDLSTGPSVCDVFDFACFQRAFREGCP